ncbi:MAG: N-acetyltransferase [Clostridia bacterium]|nr:N-acetyltransferase [Clostridia bacterium]
MTIRPCDPAREETYVSLYRNARRFMAENGNTEQWRDKDFAREVAEDLASGVLYEGRNDAGELLGVFAFLPGPDPTYAEIEGSWADDSPYRVLHRVASSFIEPGFISGVTAWAARICPHLRIDTHRDNLPMQRALAAAGFSPRGIIHLSNGEPRIAFERTDKQP